MFLLRTLQNKFNITEYYNMLYYKDMFSLIL